MNPLLSHLQPYPFERLRQLFADVPLPAGYSPISLGMGEPRHATPVFIKNALVAGLDGLANYPATAGDARLRQAFAGWLGRRYDLVVDPATQVLPINGSREALFAFAQTVIDPSRAHATVVCPNPFYQIYEGATLLAGATPYGKTPSCCLSAHPATPRERSCRWPSGKSCLRCPTGTGS